MYRDGYCEASQSPTGLILSADVWFQSYYVEKGKSVLRLKQDELTCVLNSFHGVEWMYVGGDVEWCFEEA